MSDLLWLHSGGAFNKEPKNDLGNYPSRFEISGEPPGEPNTSNNLFDDITPGEALIGLIDYRCFYIWNPTLNAIININLAIDQCLPCGSAVKYASKLQDDVQIITISCGGSSTPDNGGHVVFDTEFGPPFTIYYKGDWCQFGLDLQAAIRLQPWCTTVTVTGCNPFTITFNGDAGNRNVRLIRVVQNNLINNGLCTYNTQIYFSCYPYNSYGSSRVLVVQPISDHVPNTGDLRIYNPLTGLWDSYHYYAHDTFNFYLQDPLQFNLVGFLGSCPPTEIVPNPPYDLLNNPNNWQRWYPSPVFTEGGPGYPTVNLPLPTPWGVVEAPCNNSDYCTICIQKVTQGGPINTIAAPIASETDTPDIGTNFFTTFPNAVGNLRPNEGFYFWIQRITPPGTLACLGDYFDITITADKVSWPL